VNWRNAPAYNLAKLFSQKIRQLAPLPNTYNIENTRNLIDILKHTPLLPHFRFASLDITNLYTNIPIKDIRGHSNQHFRTEQYRPKTNIRANEMV
jgi:hypothetical protein